MVFDENIEGRMRKMMKMFIIREPLNKKERNLKKLGVGKVFGDGVFGKG